MIRWIIASSILIAVIITLRYILKGKISLMLQYALWVLVLVRLLVPVSFGSTGFSVMNTVGKIPVVQDVERVRGVGDMWHTEIGSVEGYPSYELMPETPVTVAERKTEAEFTRMERTLAFREAFVPIWLCGAAILFAVFAVSNGRFASRLRCTRKPLEVNGSELPVYITDETDTPCLFGLFHPAIYVTPEAAGEPRILRHTVEHETTHFRHGDNSWSILRGVCLALHWYNPLVWWAAFLSRRDAELACDEATINRIGENERAEYGRTLIGMTCQKRTALLITATTMTGSKSSIKERITLIAKKPRMAIYTLVAVVLVATVAVGCTFTGAKDKAPTDEWFINEAWALAEEYALGNDMELSKETATVFRYTDGISADVTFPDVDGPRSISVSFSAKDDGTWTVLPANAVNLLDPTRWDGDSDIPIELKVDKDIPNAVIAYAKDYIAQQIDAYHSAWPEIAPGCSITEAKITGLTQMNTGTAGLNTSVNLYLLEYRLLVSGNIDSVLVGGMSYKEIDGENWLTEWSSVGQPHLLLYCDDSGTEPVWDRIRVTNAEEIYQYNTPEMLEQYGNFYTAAAMELYNQYLQVKASASWADADVAH